MTVLWFGTHDLRADATGPYTGSTGCIYVYYILNELNSKHII